MKRLLLTLQICLCCALASPPVARADRSAHEVLTEGSLYLVNGAGSALTFLLESNVRAESVSLEAGDSVVYVLPPGAEPPVTIRLATQGSGEVTYELSAQQRYVLYWNRDLARYDVQSTTP